MSFIDMNYFIRKNFQILKKFSGSTKEKLFGDINFTKSWQQKSASCWKINTKP